MKLVRRTERKRTSDQIATDLRRVLVGIPGVDDHDARLGRQPAAHPRCSAAAARTAGSPSKSAATTSTTSTRIAQRRARSPARTRPGIANPQIGREEGRPELAIRVDRPKAALLGLSVSGVANTIRTNISGTQAAMFRERGKEFPIIVRLREEDRERSESVNDVLISTPQGLVLPAKQRARPARRRRARRRFERKNQQRITPRQRRARAGIALASRQGRQAGCPQVDVPQGFSVGFGAEVEQQAQAFQQLQVLLILGVLLVYAVMASQYESLRDPFIVMFSVPVAAIGVVAALKLTATSFSLQAYIGVIMLAGSWSATRSCWWTTPTSCGGATASRSGGGRAGGTHAAPADPDDDPDDDSGPGADVAGHR